MMKKQILLSICIFSAFTSKAQWVNIPDSNFGKWLTTQYPTCMQGNPQIGFQMDTTCGGIVGEFSVACYSNNIKSLEGIQFFDNITGLYCYNNQIDFLPNLPEYITILICDNNNLTTLPVLPNFLRNLSCSHNNFSNLPLMPDSIWRINFSYNNIIKLGGLPPNLEDADFSNNNIDSILSIPSTLQTLRCNDNSISYINLLNSNIQQLECNNNIINNLDNFPDSLISLSCANNNLSLLQNLPNSVQYIDCSHNNIHTISNFSSNIKTILCNNNPIQCLPQIPLLIYEINTDSTLIRCLPNDFTLNFRNSGILFNASNYLPLCGPTSGCDFYYNIAGNTHQKNEITCIDDSLLSGVGLSNIKVILKDSNQFIIQQYYTNNNGQYTFEVDSLFNYTMEVDTTNLPFMVECPTSFFQTAHLSLTDSAVFDKNFGLTCKNIKDFYIKNIYASRFRPHINTLIFCLAGNSAKLRYNANCGNNSSGTITTTFSGAVQYVSPAPNALTPIVSGNMLTYTIPNLDSLKEGDLDFVLLTDTNAPIGSQVCITTIIKSDSLDSNPSNDTVTMCYTVVNSFDPNEKTVYPKTITTDGDWLTYTIQFQNTGNDTAYTIVVKDTLPQELQAETFDYLASSHKNIIQIKGNELTFTFPKINLVDSMTNEPLSHGWVQFKIRTKNNLPPVFNIANRAAIYFDFNSPIFTNYALTTQPTGIREVNENQFSIFPNPTKNLLQIHSKERGEYTATIIDLTGRILHSTSFTDNTAIELSAYSTGIYSLILQDKNGNRNAVKVVKE